MKKTFYIFIFLSSLAIAQEKANYNFTFLRAKSIDTTEKKSVLALFYVTAKNKKDFPPVLSMKLTYGFNGTKEKTIDLMAKHGDNVSIIVYGKESLEKDKAVYNLIKDKIDINNKHFWVLGFYFRDVSFEKIKKMSFTYGLWEKRDQNRRLEKTYEFDVE